MLTEQLKGPMAQRSIAHMAACHCALTKFITAYAHISGRRHSLSKPLNYSQTTWHTNAQTHFVQQELESTVVKNSCTWVQIPPLLLGSCKIFKSQFPPL